MNPFLDNCKANTCGKCNRCNSCNECERKCGCPDSIASIEADSINPANLRYNIGGRSIWYDHTSVVRAAETCTSLFADGKNRSLNYNGECQRNVITASELGSILHLADLGDVDATSITDNAVLVYRKDANCGENCDGKNGWIGLDPSEAGDTSLDYIMGADGDGRTKSLMPPSNSNQFYYLSWAAQNKASWKQPTEVSAIPVDGDGYSYQLFLDPTTKEIVVYKKKEN